ncbi:MAG: hypothetical protein JXJ19_09485 [Elusimicrobia bacterium]|nr:hypothetical protein [Elusimicrobiota bacterium]
MTGQVLYLSIIFLTGILFTALLKPFFPDSRVIWLLGFPAGMFIWVFSTVIMIIISVPVKLPCLFILIGILFSGMMFYSYRKEHHVIGSVKKQDISAVAILAVVFLLLSVICSRYNYIHMTNDSFYHEAMGRMIARYSKINGDYIVYFTQTRLIFLSSLHGIGYLFGVRMVNAIYPVTGIWFVILFVAFCREGMKDIYIGPVKRSLILTAAGSFLASFPLYIMHTTYLLTNLMTSMYFSIALISYFLSKNENKGWMIISAFSLGATVLIRKDMAFANIIPLILFTSCKDDRIKEKFPLWQYLVIYVSIAYIWSFYGLLISGGDLLINQQFGFPFYILCFMFSIACVMIFGYTRPFKYMKRWLPAICILSLAMVLLIAVLFCPEKIIYYYRVLISYLATGRMSTKGSIGVLLCFIMIIYTVRRTADMWKYLFVITGFLLIWFIINGVYLMPVTVSKFKYHWNFSASRILLHIFPFILYSYAVFLGSLGKKALPLPAESVGRAD